MPKSTPFFLSWWCPLHWVITYYNCKYMVYQATYGDLMETDNDLVRKKVTADGKTSLSGCLLRHQSVAIECEHLYMVYQNSNKSHVVSL